MLPTPALRGSVDMWDYVPFLDATNKPIFVYGTEFIQAVQRNFKVYQLILLLNLITELVNTELPQTEWSMTVNGMRIRTRIINDESECDCDSDCHCDCESLSIESITIRMADVD